MSVASSVTDLVGSTPMLRLNRMPDPAGAEIYAKLEWFNAGGSVKDRIAKYMVEYAEAAGKLEGGRSILEATSGNTGIALAMIAAAKGYRLTVIMPESVSIERKKLVKAYGAELLLTPGEMGTSGAIELKERLLREEPERYVGIDQFRDPANIMAHYQMTGREILEQTRGRVDMVVVGVGTSGTGVGVSMRLKQFNPAIKVVGVFPELGFSIQGIRNPKDTNPTRLFRRERFDEVVELSKAEKPAIYEVARRAAREEGLIVGLSAAAILYVSLRMASDLGTGKTLVAVLPDSGLKYLSTDLFEG